MNLSGIKLIGLNLGHKTTNEGGKSNIDCGSLWQKFEQEGIQDKIIEKADDEIYAVYYAYEGDHTKPFSYFIGCKVKDNSRVPEGLDSLQIPAGDYRKYVAKGKMPDCIANTWKDIWSSEISRAYTYDFELYDERSRDWSNAEVGIYVSVKEKG